MRLRIRQHFVCTLFFISFFILNASGGEVVTVSNASLQNILSSADLQKVIGDANKLLDNPFSTGRLKRPPRCPLAATSGQTILEKLDKIYTSLQGGKCENKNKDLVAGFGGIVKEIDGFLKKKNDIQSGGVAAPLLPTGELYQGQNILIRAQKAMDILGNLTSIEVCAYDIREKGVVPVIADIITNFSQMALLAPGGTAAAINPNALIFAAGGLAVGSVMKILYNLFKPTFRFEKVEERKQYIDLICSYYTTRMELEEMQFFKIKTSEDKENLKRIKQIEESIQKKIKELEERKDLEVVSGMECGSKKQSLLDDLNKIIEKISSSKMDSKKRELEFKRDIPNLLTEITELIKPLDLSAKKYPLLNLEKSHSELTSGELLNEIRGKSVGDVAERILNPLLTIQVVLEAEEKLAKNRVVTSDYETAISKLIDLSGRVKKNREILEKIVDKQNYVASDEGSHLGQSIFESYNKTQKIIFGPSGEDFLQYILKQAIKSEKEFINLIEPFEAKYLKSRSGQVTTLSQEQKITGCRTAKQIERQYSHLESLVNMGTDFIDTNKDLFYDTSSRKSLVNRVFRANSSSPYLLKQADSLQKTLKKYGYDSAPSAAAFSADGSAFVLESVQDIKLNVKLNFKKLLIGDFITILEDNLKKTQMVRAFMVENLCDNLLSK